MEAVAFDNKIIQGHRLYCKCGKTLDTASKKDYPNNNYFDTSIQCLDMDDYETQTCRGQQTETVDAVIGIKSHAQNRFSRQRLLLVELRMNYKNPCNLSQSELENKVRHTRELLGTGTPIETTSWFIFKNGIIEQVKSWFINKSRAGGAIRNFIPLSTEMFNNYVKSEHDFPYKPITDLNALKNELQSYIGSKDLQGFYDKTDWWKNKAFKYKNQQNNSEEFCCIMDVVKDVWTTFRSLLHGQQLSDDDEFYIEVIDENLY